MILFSTMQKTLAFIAVALLAIIIVVGPVNSATAPDEFVIPLDRYVNLSSDLTIHTLYVTISKVTYGGAYSPDPVNMTWPILTFQYENYGTQQVAGRLHAQFVDDAGSIYDKPDIYMGGPIYPGKKSPPVTLEIAMPKDRKLTGLIVIDEWTNKQVLIPIEYPSVINSLTPGSPSEMVIEGDTLRNLFFIPIILVIVGLVGWYIAKTKLF